MGWYGLDFNLDGEISFVEHVLSEDILGDSSCDKRRRHTDDTDRELDSLFLQDDLSEREKADILDTLERDICDLEDPCSDFDNW